jgi:alpha 1,2-mannosyltransferase
MALHFTLTITHDGYGRAASLSAITSYLTGKSGTSDFHPDNTGSSALPQTIVGHRANATFVMLARNSDVGGAIRSIRALEDRFNNRYGYPYVFLNDVPFSDDFKR